MRQSFLRKSVALAACIMLITVCMATDAFAEAVPLYSFDYDGHHIDTYASYSVVDGVPTDNFRYFVKNGNLVVVDNSVNSVPDGIFLHYDSGDSYIAALTNGGQLVSMGTVDLPTKLKEFTNRGIDSIASNVEDDTHTLIVNYSNGATVAYDVLTGEVLFRTDAQKDEDLLSYIKNTVSDLLTSNQSSSASAKKEAEAVVGIMNAKGYSLEQLLNNGVFSSSGKFKEFIETGSLGDSNTTSAGSTGDVSDVSNQSKTAAERLAEEAAATSVGEGVGESQGEEPTHASKAADEEAGGSSSAGTDIKSSYTVTTDNVNKKNSTSGTGSSKTSAVSSTNKNSNTTATSKTSTGVNNNNSATANSKTGSVVFVHETTGEGKSTGAKSENETVNGQGKGQGEKKEGSTGTNKEASDKTGGSKSAGGEKSGDKGQSTGTDKKSAADQKGSVGAQSKDAAGADTKVADAGDGKDGKDADSKSADGKGADKKSADGKDSGGKSGTGDKKNGMKAHASTDYVSVYNADTNGYDIYSVDELMDNPQDAKSENEKLGTEDNNKIAQLLSVKEDETNERGLSLYVVVIIGIVVLLVGVLLVMKSVGKKGEGEA